MRVLSASEIFSIATFLSFNLCLSKMQSFPNAWALLSFFQVVFYGTCGSGKGYCCLRTLLYVFLLSVLCLGDCQLHTSCGIQKCTTDFVSFTSHLNAALEDFDLEFCKALRAYSVCTYRNSKVCRGNLVYHSAVLGIGDLMTQRNCTKDGPTSSTNPEMTRDPCNYSGHAEVREHQGGEKTTPPTYLFCGLFGDPHLRTFKDHFQTCKVEGAWPLIDNNYLSVQVTNVPVVPGSNATATNKVLFLCTVHAWRSKRPRQLTKLFSPWQWRSVAA